MQVQQTAQIGAPGNQPPAPAAPTVLAGEAMGDMLGAGAGGMGNAPVETAFV